jgi:predicted O-methyltransferase YrrM
MTGKVAVTEFCPELAEMLRTRRARGRSGRIFDGLGAISTVHNLSTIRALMLEMRASRTLEIGLGFGGSSLVFCASHKELGWLPQYQHTALDPLQSTVWDSCGLEALERAGLIGYLDFRQTYSALELPKLFEERSVFDLIYVDGSHLFEDVFVDAYFSARMLRDGGVIAFDDSSNPHIAKVVRFLRSNLTAGLKELDLSKYRDKQKRLKYQIARRLGKVQLTAFRRIGSIDRQWNTAYQRF